MSQGLPRGARALVLALGHGAQCYTTHASSFVAAYLEQHGRRSAIDLPALDGLVAAGYVAVRRRSGSQQTYALTAKGRRLYRALIQPGWQRWLPWTPLQRLQLALLPLCLLLGMAADVVLGELNLATNLWARVGRTGVVLLPLLVAYVWLRWR